MNYEKMNCEGETIIFSATLNFDLLTPKSVGFVSQRRRMCLQTKLVSDTGFMLSDGYKQTYIQIDRQMYTGQTHYLSPRWGVYHIIMQGYIKYKGNTNYKLTLTRFISMFTSLNKLTQFIRTN